MAYLPFLKVLVGEVKFTNPFPRGKKNTEDEIIKNGGNAIGGWGRPQTTGGG